jgi:hypothetical protein
MIEQSMPRLQYLCNIIPPLLTKLSEDEFSCKIAPEKWSKKEILGHLIDSATNNHQRFVRVQFEDVPTITYNQNLWNHYSYYNKMNSAQLIKFWELYNYRLAELIACIPEHLLQRECNIGKDANVTLEWLIDDYVRHLEHHLKQLVEYQ